MRHAESIRLGAVKAQPAHGDTSGGGDADTFHHKRHDLGGGQAQPRFRHARGGIAGYDGDIGHTEQAETTAQGRAVGHDHDCLRRAINLGQHLAEAAVECNDCRVRIIARDSAD